MSGNTLIYFLDKFVYRNAKKNVAQKGASVMQPAAAAYDAGKVRLQKGAKVGAESGVVNSEAFWRKKVAEVPVDQVCTFPIRIDWGYCGTGSACGTERSSNGPGAAEWDESLT